MKVFQFPSMDNRILSKWEFCMKESICSEKARPFLQVTHTMKWFTISFWKILHPVELFCFTSKTRLETVKEVSVCTNLVYGQKDSSSNGARTRGRYISRPTLYPLNQRGSYSVKEIGICSSRATSDVIRHVKKMRRDSHYIIYS